MSYRVVDEFADRTFADAFLPGTSDPNRPRQMYSPAAKGPPFLTGTGAITTAFSGRQRQMRDLKGLGGLVPSLDPNAIVGPVVAALQPAINNQINAVVPRIKAEVSSAISTGITQGINANLPKIRSEIAAQKTLVEKQLEPAKAAAVALGLICVATLGVSLVVLSRQK